MSLAFRLRFGETPRPVALRYGAALLSIPAALGLSLLLEPLTAGRLPALLFVLAIVVVSWYGGLGPALVATGLAVAALEVFLLAPSRDPLIDQATDLVALAVFVAVAVLVSWISGRTRLALDELRRRTEELQVRQAEAGSAMTRLRDEVAQRRKSDEALRRREAEVRALVEHTPDLMVRLDRELRYLYLNPAVEKMLGRSAGEFLGHTLAGAARYAPAGLVARWEETVREVFASGEPATSEFSLPSPNGPRFLHTRVVPESDDGGTVETVLAISRDITDRRAAEERQAVLVEAGRLATSSLDAATIVEGLAELAVRRLAEWCVVSVLAESGDAIERVSVAASDAERRAHAEEILRLHPPSLDRRDLPLARALLDREETLVPRIDDALLESVATDAEHLALLRGLGLRSMIVVPLQARGRVLGAISFGTAAPDRRYGADDLALARELATQAALALDNARLYAELGQAVRLRDDILAIVAHDLRNPLHVISSLVGVFEDDDGGARRFDVRRAAGAVRRALGRADRLIQDLLDISRIEAGRLSVSPQVVDVGSIVAEVCESAQAKSTEKGLRIEGTVDDGCPPLAADRGRVVQALANLLDNALEHSPDGARVTVSASAVGHPGEVELVVADEGPGIREEDLPHLFDRFWQGRRATRGTGLGLAIVKGIAEAHGGRVAVSSLPGKGATFRIVLPAAEEAAAGAAEERDAAAG
jgi:PAS domain S-box-containing protein